VANDVLSKKGGTISIGYSVGTRLPFPGTTDYAVKKAAVIVYRKGRPDSCSPRHLRAHCYAGVMETEMAADAANNLPPIITGPTQCNVSRAALKVATVTLFLRAPRRLS
jgi:hypothetical protein